MWFRECYYDLLQLFSPKNTFKNKYCFVKVHSDFFLKADLTFRVKGRDCRGNVVLSCDFVAMC